VRFAASAFLLIHFIPQIEPLSQTNWPEQIIHRLHWRRSVRSSYVAWKTCRHWPDCPPEVERRYRLAAGGSLVSADPSGRNTYQIVARSKIGHRRRTEGAPHPPVFFGRFGIFWTTFRPETRYFTVAGSTGNTISVPVQAAFPDRNRVVVQARDCVEVDRPETMLRGPSSVLLRRFEKRVPKNIGG